MSITQPLEQLQTFSQWSRHHPGLRLLILFGSRARSDHDPTSDWDIAFLSDSNISTKHSSSWFPDLEILTTLSDFAGITQDRIDLVDLSVCNDILAHVVARDGQLIYERHPGEFARFQQQALKTPDELQQFRQAQRQKVLDALVRWGV
ncbi:nucleotidyltransferase domain-containing protein [Nodosilinea sp. P-1105]|uniref:type VII toxin-antitoxin system MntA family adenylyltransferase antitoxin n=1 Tax=Nodosilinea sp. P-1105 TaxID=2546229 RepID=UPI00146C5B8A|nr:nucleotidyltransferase domain-containing protein [Nodosilinea sp. P-1105]NMF81794.1 nucleotidyltransferase domain-containing protein [Nodosilinea sp. P-1105]